MVASVVEGVGIAGIVASLPAAREGRDQLAARFGADAADRLIKATGIAGRHLAPPGLCTSDLAEAAARTLLQRLAWPADSIDLLILVSQTGDFLLPATACLLQNRLGLNRRCAAFDLTLGCSGYVYGLWVASTLLKTLSAGGGRALLLAGDTTSRLCAADDRAVAPLFGDGASATALECRGEAAPMVFDLGTDGTGAPYLCVAGGGQRHPEAERRLMMDGTQVFAFTLREVPRTVQAVLADAGWTLDAVDRLVLHQANAQMIRHLGHKLGAAPDQMVLALAEVGNTSSASIPLALAGALGGELERRSLRLVLSGFGVGWSWASAAVRFGPLATGLVEVGADGTVTP